jgi:hypothetical protein
MTTPKDIIVEKFYRIAAMLNVMYESHGIEEHCGVFSAKARGSPSVRFLYESVIDKREGAKLVVEFSSISPDEENAVKVLGPYTTAMFHLQLFVTGLDDMIFGKHGIDPSRKLFTPEMWSIIRALCKVHSGQKRDCPEEVLQRALHDAADKLMVYNE